MAELLANNAASQLNGGITNVATSLVVDNGSVFPATGNFRIIIDSELMLCTARATNTLTVTRGIESTSAVSHLDNAPVTHVLTAAGLDTFITEEVTTQVSAAAISPSARAYHNANQNATTAVSLVLALNSERFDTDTIHDTVTNNSRLTCKTAGKYLITGSAVVAANATGHRNLSILFNGTTTIATQRTLNLGASVAVGVSVATIYDMAVNDYVELTLLQDSGTTLAVVSNANYSPEFAMVRVA